MTQTDALHRATGAAHMVSVVMPCHNGERYIAEAVESVLEQTWSRRELIVVDDGSDDRSVEVVRRFGASVSLHRQPRAGAGAARNAGVALARWGFLAFLDADDLWPSDALAVRMEAFARRPEPDLVAGLVEQFPSREIEPSVRARIGGWLIPTPARLPGTMVVRREAFDRVGAFPTGLAAGEALDWYMRADEEGLRSVFVEQVVLRRRIHAHNLGRICAHCSGDYLKVVKAALDRRRVAARGAGHSEEPS